MVKTFAIAALAASILIVSGCATKRYGRLQPLTSYETINYDCNQIDLELSKVDAFELQVAEQKRFSGMSVASFLGDFGIGNVIERNQAEATAVQRRAQLENLRQTRSCGAPATAAAARPGAPAAQPAATWTPVREARVYRCTHANGEPYMTTTATPAPGCVEQ